MVLVSNPLELFGLGGSGRWGWNGRGMRKGEGGGIVVCLRLVGVWERVEQSVGGGGIGKWWVLLYRLEGGR